MSNWRSPLTSMRRTSRWPHVVKVLAVATALATPLSLSLPVAARASIGSVQTWMYSPAMKVNTSTTISIADFTDNSCTNGESCGTVSIDWGDASSSAGTIVWNSNTSAWTVTGTHSYSSTGSKSGTLHLDDGLGSTQVNSFSVNVFTNLTLAGASDPLTFTAGNSGPSGSLAAITYSGFNGCANMSFSEDWGDGSSVTFNGSASMCGSGSTSLSGVNHTYSHIGSYTITLNARDSNSSTNTMVNTIATASLPVVVRPNSYSVTTPSSCTPSFQFNVGVAETCRVGWFSAPYGSASDFTASVNWGDGTEAGVVDGSGNITSTHTYSSGGNDKTVTVTLTDAFANSVSLGTSSTFTVYGWSSGLTAVSNPTFTMGNNSSANLATFSYLNNGCAGSFTYSADWGDGGGVTTGSAQVNCSGSSPNYTYTVQLSHNYATIGSFTVALTITDSSNVSRSVSVPVLSRPSSSSVSVFNCSPDNTPVVGSAATCHVAQFSVNSGSPQDYTATVDWGENTEVGNIDSGGNITSTHTFATAGNNNKTVSVTISDGLGHSVSLGTSSTFSVNGWTSSGLTAYADPIVVAEASGNTLPVAVANYTVQGQSCPSTSGWTYSAVWGDGTNDATNVPANVNCMWVNGANQLQVQVGHEYDQIGSYTLHLTVVDASSVSRSVDVNILSAPQSGQLYNYSPTEAVPFTREVASFNAYYGLHEAPSDFTASINWGDGTSSAGTVDWMSGVTYWVNGTHTYNSSGSKAVSVTLTDADGHSSPIGWPSGGSFGDGSTTATYNVNALSISGPWLSGGLNATTGVPFTRTMATFSAHSDAVISATIHWGDGTTSDTTGPDVVVTSEGINYYVTGTHTYTTVPAHIEDNDISVSVTGGSVTQSTTATACWPNVTALTVGSLAMTSTPFAATENASLSADPIATFTSSDGAVVTATIHWGDTQSSAGTVTETSADGDSSTFSVSGSHTYADVATDHPTVTLSGLAFSDGLGGTVTTIDSTDSATVVVANAIIVVTTAPIAPAATVPFSGTVATVVDDDTSRLATNYSASIDWGDGSDATVGTVTLTSAGHFSVAGSHTFAAPATHSLAVTITDASGGVGANSTGILDITVGALPIDSLAMSHTTINATELTSFDASALATFTSDVNAPIGSFTATITWGDDQTSAGEVTTDSAGNFSVAGSHTYASVGTYHPTVEIVGGGTTASSTDASDSADQQATVVVADAAVDVTVAAIAPTAGTSFSGTVATFVDSDTSRLADNYSASINWGDGTDTSTGTVALTSAGHFDVTGSHTYTESGAHTVVVTITDATGGDDAVHAGSGDITVAAASVAPTPSPTAAPAAAATTPTPTPAASPSATPAPAAVPADVSASASPAAPAPDTLTVATAGSRVYALPSWIILVAASGIAGGVGAGGFSLAHVVVRRRLFT